VYITLIFPLKIIASVFINSFKRRYVQYRLEEA